MIVDQEPAGARHDADATARQMRAEPRCSRNGITVLSFASPHVQVLRVDDVEDFPIEGRAIVLNPSIEHAHLSEPPEKTLAPLNSTLLRDVTVARADRLLVMQEREQANMGDIIREKGWGFFGDVAPMESSFPRNTPLWRSPQDSLGFVEFDPRFVSGQSQQQKEKCRFEIKVNLWFATAKTHCHIHNDHEFLEVHTQVYGLGRMQKFKAQDFATLYEEISMAPGYTTPVPFCNVESDGRLVYPWHQYYAETDCIWLAVEYHFAEPKRAA